MNGEEIERAIDFLLKNQATLETRVVGLVEQIGETNRIVQMHAETQSEFIQIVTKVLGDLAEVQRNADARATATETRNSHRFDGIDERLGRLAEAGARTDARINKLAETGARTDARLDRLAAVVERLAGKRGTE